MGWLLTLFLALPQVDGQVQVDMWFSKKSYCTFAQEKFTEQPIYRIMAGGERRAGQVKETKCRALGPEDTHRIPPHMRHILDSQAEDDLYNP